MRPGLAATPPPLRRHRLARLTDAGWADVLARAWDAQARACLTLWAARRLPLVVARQPAEAVAGGRVALGLSAPGCWDRRRLALRVPSSAIDGFDEFPCLGGAWALDGAPSASVRALAGELGAALGARQAVAHVFGSHGWRAITGLDHVRPTSDLDLWIAVDGAAHADGVAAALAAFEGSRPRLDGELVFADGAAVAWREWIEWRAGRARAVLVRHLEGIALRHDTGWCAAPAAERGA